MPAATEGSHPTARRSLGARCPLPLVGATAVSVVVVALLLVAVTLGWAPMAALDHAVAVDAHREAVTNALLTQGAFVLTAAARPAVIDVLSILVVVLALVLRGSRVALFAVVALLAPWLGSLLKTAVARPRPGADVATYADVGFSFPSGHAVGATTVCLTAVVVVTCHPGAGSTRRRSAVVVLVVAAVLAVSVATARVVLGVHYLSDVVAGVALGVAWTGLAALLCAPYGTGRRSGPGGDGPDQPNAPASSSESIRA